MKYDKKLKPRKIETDEGIKFHCTKCDTYKHPDFMVHQKYSPDGIARTCRVCYRELYQPVKTENKRRSRKTTEEYIQSEKNNKEFKHLNLHGITQEDRDFVKEMFKRMGYNEYEPIWVQFHRRKNLPIPYAP